MNVVNFCPVLAELEMYAPNSAGDETARAAITLKTVAQVFPCLNLLIKKCEGRVVAAREMDSFSASTSAGASTELKALFDHFGSDKATAHDYHLLYGHILQNREKIQCVVEIGLGSNFLDTVSNMGDGGKPGASLRAFKKFHQTPILSAPISINEFFSMKTVLTHFMWIKQIKNQWQSLRRAFLTTLIC